MFMHRLFRNFTASIIVLFVLGGALFLLENHPNISTIFGGVALFLIGMEYMENGFKAFSGSLLEKILERFTNNTPKAIFTGFTAPDHQHHSHNGGGRCYYAVTFQSQGTCQKI